MFIWYSQISKKQNKIKFTYNGRGIAFDGEGSWRLVIDFARNVVIFGGDSSSSSHTDYRKNNFLILGEGPTQAVSDSTVEQKKN